MPVAISAIIKMLILMLGYVVVRLLSASYRFRAVHPPLGASPPSGYLLATWHQNLFAGILAQRSAPHCVMISRSRDGDFVTSVCERLGHRVLRGSSRSRGCEKGGREAKDEMILALIGGESAALTVDGPRGPAHQVKPGIVEIARASGKPIVPYLSLASRYWTLPSWDDFRIPKPFARIDICYGLPIMIPGTATALDFAQYQQQIGTTLQALESSERAARLLA